MHSVIFNIVVMLAAASARPQPWGVWAQMQRSNQAQPRQYFVKADQEFQPSEYPGYDFSNPEGQSSFDQSDVGQSNFGGQGNFDSPGQFEDQGHFMGLNLKSHAYPVHQHVEESNPEPIKHYKEVVVPIPQNVEFKVNQPVLIPVPHPVPIHVPVPKAVVIPIVKEVSIPVEKSIPYPVHKIVHYPKIKEVPFEVVKHVIVTVDKPVPFKVPVYETILHTKKGSHKI